LQKTLWAQRCTHPERITLILIPLFSNPMKVSYHELWVHEWLTHVRFQGNLIIASNVGVSAMLVILAYAGPSLVLRYYLIPYLVRGPNHSLIIKLSDTHCSSLITGNDPLCCPFDPANVLIVSVLRIGMHLIFPGEPNLTTFSQSCSPIFTILIPPFLTTGKRNGPSFEALPPPSIDLFLAGWVASSCIILPTIT
jgi:hypothetical protein